MTCTDADTDERAEREREQDARPEEVEAETCESARQAVDERHGPSPRTRRQVAATTLPWSLSLVFEHHFDLLERTARIVGDLFGDGFRFGRVRSAVTGSRRQQVPGGKQASNRAVIRVPAREHLSREFHWQALRELEVADGIVVDRDFERGIVELR